MGRVLILMTGTTLSQVILIAASPILTRIYSPAEFGIFALFFAFTQVLMAVAGLRYELAIILPKEDEEAVDVLTLSAVIIIVMSVGSLFIMLLFRHQIAALLKAPEIARYLWLIPVALLWAALFQSLSYWNIRKKQFEYLALAKVSRSSTTVAIQVGLGFFASLGSFGLIMGDIVGKFVATGILLKNFFREYRTGIRYTPSVENIKNAAVRYKRNPLFLTNAYILLTLNQHLPLLFLMAFFNPTVAGIYALAKNTIDMPSSFVGLPISQVFLQKASKHYRETGSCRDIYVLCLKHMVFLSAVPAFILFIFAPSIFAVVFGPTWEEAGVYVRILIPMFYARFIIAPLSMIFIISENQLIQMLWHLALIICNIVALVLGGLTGSPRYALTLYSFTYLVLLVICGILNYHLSYRNNYVKGETINAE